MPFHSCFPVFSFTRIEVADTTHARCKGLTQGRADHGKTASLLRGVVTPNKLSQSLLPGMNTARPPGELVIIL